MLHRGDRRTLTTKQVRETEAEAVAFVVKQSGLRLEPHPPIMLSSDLCDVQHASADKQRIAPGPNVT